MTDQSDEALMMAYQDGNEAALETLVRRHADGLLGYLVKMTGSHAQAEDLFQETFVRVHKKSNTFRADGRFKPWLYAIGTNLALDFLRKVKRQPATLSFDYESPDAVSLKESVSDGKPGPDDDAAKADLRKEVRTAVEQLPPRQRATLVLAYFEDLPYKEVAQTLGCSVGTVKTQMSRALKTLAKSLPQLAVSHAKGGAA